MYVLGDRNVSGTYTGEIAKGRAYVNGTAKAFGGTFENGDFSYYIGSGVTSVTDKFEIEGLDKNDQILVAKQNIDIVEE